MITLAHYLMGRDRTHGLQLGPDLLRNAARTVELANALLVLAKGAGVPIEPIGDGGAETVVASGWRPADINARTPGAAARSLHITCEAIDLHDPDGLLDGWLASDAGQKVLADLGLWLEAPAFTKGWAHVQTRPPKSGRRIFYP